MGQITVLASGEINQSDNLKVELVRPSDMPAVIVIRWPGQPTISDPGQLSATASAAMRILANAVTRLAGMRASGQ
jgi:hypothetical protein